MNTARQETLDPTNNALVDPAAVQETLELLLARGQVFEIRVLKATRRDDRSWRREYYGYFDDPGQAAAALAEFGSFAGAYFTPNPVDNALLARCHNRLRPAEKGLGTSDANVSRRRYLLIDCDPRRPAGISATDAEHELALHTAKAVRAFVLARGWGEPVLADSGNGAHVLVLIDLPSDEGGLVKRLLHCFALLFDGAGVKVDTSVFNPARIWKLYGTLACKGDPLPDRPHRMARILSAPAELEPVPEEKLRGLVDALMPEKVTPQGTRPTAAGLTAEVMVKSKARVGPREMARRIQRCKSYLERCPDAVSGDHGHDKTLRAACECLRFGLDDAAAMDVMRWFNQVKTAGEPWTDDQLQHKLDAARTKVPASEFGSRLSGERRTDRPSDDPWPDPKPIPTELPSVPSFAYDLLPDAFTPWVRDIAERIQCPPDFPAVAAMIGLAGVVGRKVGIRPKRQDDWLVVPNLWGGVVGRPGVMKTPALQEPLRPLKRLEVEAKKHFDQQAREHDAAEIVAEARKSAARDAAKKFLKAGDEDAEEKAMEAALGAVTEEREAPVRKRYIVNDCSVEKLGEILNENPNGVLVFRDELVGLLRSLDKEGQESARAFYLEAWNGNGRFTYDRIGRGTVDIEAACVSVLGGIQPGPLCEYLRQASKGGGGDDGLMQRFQMAVWPDVSKEWVNVDRWPEREAKATAYAVMRKLDMLTAEDVGAERDPSEADGIPFLRFCEEAQVLFDAWRAQLEVRVRSGHEPPALESHLAKYRSLVPSLALLLHLADGGTGPVTEAAVRKAIAWSKYLEGHARRIFSAVVSGERSAAVALARKITSGELQDGFTLRDVYRPGWSRLSSREDAISAVELLIERGWLREAVAKTGGADKTHYRINPEVLAEAETASGATDNTDKCPPDPPSGRSVSASGAALFPAQAPEDEGEGVIEV